MELSSKTAEEIILDIADGRSMRKAIEIREFPLIETIKEISSKYPDSLGKAMEDHCLKTSVKDGSSDRLFGN